MRDWSPRSASGYHLDLLNDQGYFEIPPLVLHIHSDYSEFQQRVAVYTAPLMFWLSLTFLVCIACLVVLLVDVPNLQENAAGAAAEGLSESEIQNQLAMLIERSPLERAVVGLMLAIWPLVIIETAFHWLSRPWNRETRKCHWLGVLFCICPALRMCARSPEMGNRMWLNGWGWRHANKRLRRRLERMFSVPMILIALMIMPILIVEFFLKAQVAEYAWLRLLLHVGTGVIWFAFAFEFILMVSVAEKKLAYCRQHWIDLAIILLPLISFLRSLRVLRASRLMRIPKLTKFVRVYRLRGTAVKATKALVLLDVSQRLFSGNPQRTINKLQARLEEIEEEAKQVRRKIAKLRQLQEEQESTEQGEGSDQIDEAADTSIESHFPVKRC